MSSIFKKIGYLNAVLIGLTLLLWIGVFFIGNLFGVYAWVLLKLVLPFIGILGLFMNIVIFIIFVIRRKKSLKLLINSVVNLVLAFPLFMTLNIILYAYPNTIQHAQPSIHADWPLTEDTVVGWGGNQVEDNEPHAVWPSERWAYDLVMEPHNINSDRNEDYGIWNKQVLSPVSGTVIAATDNEADITPGLEDFISIEGNHVYIKINETGTYLLLNHLKKDSVSVKAGDHVNPGDALGRVGNSGSTSEPHLHIHHQKQDPTKVIHPILAEGLPLFFKDISGDPMPKKETVIKPKAVQ